MGNIIVTSFLSDFESIQPTIDQQSGNKTQLIREHKPCGYGYIVVSPYAELNSGVKIYRGEKCAKSFLEALDAEYEKIKDKLNNVAPMLLTRADEIKFSETETCSICLKDLSANDPQNPTVADHDHISGVFRGAAHSQCNIQCRQQKRIIVYMHNAKG